MGGADNETTFNGAYKKPVSDLLFCLFIYVILRFGVILFYVYSIED